MTDLIAFHGDAALKGFVLEQIAAHRAADRLTKGAYWQNGKGCAVGCTLEAVRLHTGATAEINHGQHALYETELGIPRVLAHLEDKHFERMANGDSQQWPERFISAIRPGANLAMVWPRYAIWLLTDELPQRSRWAPTKVALAEVAELYREWLEGAKPSAERWLRVWKAADAADAYAAYAAADAADAAHAYAAADAAYAAYAAASADADAAYAAYAYAAASADADAAYAAYAAADAADAAHAYAAASADAADAADAYAAADAAAADAADAAAYAAADAAYAAYAAADAADAARASFWKRSGDKLIELMEAA